MKIGIITMPPEYNYGGILQMFALQTTLLSLGHDVHIVRCKELLKEPSKFIYIFRFIKKILTRPFGGHVDVFREKKYNRNFPIYTKFTWPFVEKHIRSFIVNERFVAPENEFEALIVGSDQVWRPIYFKRCYGVPISRMFLDYTQHWNIKRIAYAASFGVDFWEYSPKETQDCSKAASLFDAISVRESSGTRLCKEFLNVDAEWVLDPTLLVQANDYVKMLGLEKSDSPSVTSYVLDNSSEKNCLIELLKSKFSDLTFKQMGIQNHKNVKPLTSIEEWVQTIASSRFVFTDSFHGCVFSIIFNVPFAVYANAERGGTRFSSLLKMLGLESRLVTNQDDLSKVIDTPINWNEVNQKRQEMIEKSFVFLRKALV